MADHKLSPKLAEKYTLKGILPGVVRRAGRDWDLRTMDLKQAKELIGTGFKYLVEKPKPQETKD